MMRVLILTDSLALPRETPEQVSYEETWIAFLKQQLDTDIVIHQVSIGGATIDTLWGQYAYHKLFRPDIIVIQCGIVDCAPRALSVTEDVIINSNRFTKYLGNIVLSRYKVVMRERRGITKTHPDKYKKILTNFKNLTDTKVFVIEIINGFEEYERIAPGIIQSINKFNTIITSVFNTEDIIPMTSIVAADMMSDFHHLNKQGHFKLAKMLANRISIVLNHKNQ